jgi:hypothetical protein
MPIHRDKIILYCMTEEAAEHADNVCTVFGDKPYCRQLTAKAFTFSFVIC